MTKDTCIRILTVIEIMTLEEMWFSCSSIYCTCLTCCYPYTEQVRPRTNG